MATDGRTWHDQINVTWPVGGRWSLEADWKHKDFSGENYAYYEIRAGLSLHWSPRWALSTLYERTTEPAIVAARADDLARRKGVFHKKLRLQTTDDQTVRQRPDTEL